MPFRVGLMFGSPPQQPYDAAPLVSLLGEIEERTKTARNNHPITLTAFLKSKTEADFVAGLSASPDAIEAGFWGPGGVAFRSLPTLLADMQAGQEDDRTEVGRGLEALLSLSHVVVILCPTASGADEVGNLLREYVDTSVLIALITAGGGGRRFLEINPSQARLDATDWFLKVKKRWEIEQPDARSLAPPRTPLLRRIFPYLASAIIRRRFQTVKKREPSESERCQGGMGISKIAMEKLAPADVTLLNANLSALCPFFARHDDLGRVHGNTFRTICFLVPTLIAVSTVLAVLGIIDHDRHIRWHVIEGVLLVLAAWLYFWARISRQHARWVEHRLTCELMRSAILTNLLHTIPRLSPPDDDPGLWDRQTGVFWIYLRSLPICHWSTPPADLLSARRSAVADYATSQKRFHADFAEQHFSIHNWLVALSGWAFVATLVLVVAQLALAFLEGAGQLKDFAYLEHAPAKLMVVTLSCACGAFVLSLLAHQLGFEKIAERSANAAQEFDVLVNGINQEADSADAQKVYGWADRCAAIIWGEQQSWYRHVPFIRMHL
jgi:hypothetical protein